MNHPLHLSEVKISSLLCNDFIQPTQKDRKMFAKSEHLPKKGAVSNCKFETAPRTKKPVGGFFVPGNLRFSLANPKKRDQTTGENCGVEPQSKKHGGVDQMQNAFETPPLLFLASVSYRTFFQICFCLTGSGYLL